MRIFEKIIRFFFNYTFFFRMRFFFEYAFFLAKLYVFFNYTFFYQNYTFFFRMRFLPKLYVFLKMRIFFPMRFFLHIRFLYVFQQNYTYLCVFFKLCPVLYVFFLFWKLVTMQLVRWAPITPLSTLLNVCVEGVEVEDRALGGLVCRGRWCLQVG